MQRMQRKQIEQAQDNLETIQSVEQHLRGEAQDVRIRMLRFLVEGSMVIVGC